PPVVVHATTVPVGARCEGPPLTGASWLAPCDPLEPAGPLEDPALFHETIERKCEFAERTVDAARQRIERDGRPTDRLEQRSVWVRRLGPRVVHRPAQRRREPERNEYVAGIAHDMRAVTQQPVGARG